MTYTEAIFDLEKYHASAVSGACPFAFEPKWGHGLHREHEKRLSEVLLKGPVFVTDYPSCEHFEVVLVHADER
jgi:asparaginyl-tRNA synthetase